VRKVVSQLGALMRLLCCIVAAASMSGILSAQGSAAARVPDFVLDTIARGGIPLWEAPDPDYDSRRPPQPAPPISHAARSQARAAIELRSMDSKSYVWGEEFVYELLIVNTGSIPFSVPYSVEASLVRSARYRERLELLEASVLLEVSDTKGRFLGVLQTQYMAGAREELRTLQTLESGQSAVLRLRGRWLTNAPDHAYAILKQPGAVVGISATLLIAREGLLAKSVAFGPIVVEPAAR
jgi:hypothetical protein